MLPERFGAKTGLTVCSLDGDLVTIQIIIETSSAKFKSLDQIQKLVVVIIKMAL